VTSLRRREEGSVAAEFVGILPLLLVVAIIGWQLLLIVGAGTSTATAARNGSRALSTDEDHREVVERSLPAWLRDGHVVAVDDNGSEVSVQVRVPVLFPGVTAEAFRLTRSADLPRSR
jgi:pilus assembly protein CpaE